MDQERKMFKGNWSCGQCGASITELPFEPDPARAGGLTCKDCFKKKRDTRDSSRPTHKGNWSCSKCGAAITELPFEPDPARANTLSCKDCFKASRQ